MKNPKVLLMCFCCALVGVVLGVGLGRVSESGDGTKSDAGKNPAVIDSQGATSKSGGKADASGEFPDLAGLKTPEQWRGYIERWMTAGCPPGQQKNVFEGLRRWSEVDADGALAFVDGAAKFPTRNTAYGIPLTAIGTKNMGRVIDWLQKNLSQRDRSDIAGFVIMELKDTHPEEAWVLARADDISVAPHYFGEIMQSMLKTDPAGSLRVLESLPDRGKSRVVKDFAIAWLNMDESAALEWCARQRDKPYGSEMFFHILEYYAKEKPSSILATIERLNVVFEQNLYYGDFMNKLAWNDPLIALATLQKMPADKIAHYGRDVIRELLKTDADQAVAAARVIWPDEVDRTDNLWRSYANWARSDRKAAEVWLENEADGALREQIKTKQLLWDNPAAFLGSVDVKINTPLMENYINEAMRMAARHGQSDEALHWLLANPDQITSKRVSCFQYANGPDGKIPLTPMDVSAVPEGKGREALIDFVAEASTDTEDWQSAVELLPLVTDSGKQDALRFKIFSSMMSNESEREAAREWLATQPLSEEVRASWETLAEAAAKE
ncbi:hypothetical protein M2447_002479 [Ereboglobus sp. PH5-10]|uniref:hypothetical protein n=1 Tax=Ereboglobus sp. PH5-10 TaxID=2940629 RepID=UPI0024061403|nr:hypothetical protein [Ereboglobus sp. PH5-10]MDF9828361.1 hypothetical protein [Ereboglobus sp. PH5-10]